MRETIGNYADFVGWMALVTLAVAVTVESVAKQQAIKAAFFSPIAILLVLGMTLWLAEHFGWIKPQ